MANQYPIQRLSLEFIVSNVTDFENIVKINIIKTPGVTGRIEFFELTKVVIDKANIDVLQDEFDQHVLQYLGNQLYMDNIIYMGGFDIEANAKTMGTLNIRTTRIDDLRYLLDYTLDPLDVLLYYITYRYNNVIYQTPVVVSYKPLESKPLIDVNPRPCLTARNIRYRGPNESAKYNAHSKEVFCDMRNLNSFKDIVANDNNDNLDEIDSLYRSVYNSTDRLMLYNKLVLGSL